MNVDITCVGYSQKRKLGNQTIELGMNCLKYDRGKKPTVWFNIYLTLYTKRRDRIDVISDDTKITGTGNPFQTMGVVREMFDEVLDVCVNRELHILKDLDPKCKPAVRVFCTGTDSRRLRVYYKFLSRKYTGFSYGKTFKGQRCVIATYRA